MKVQCDVCEKAQATILCCADEASLCADCDTRVHTANKLASKHQRVPLMYPSNEDLPCCDICQEKTGYFFCLEDRALLCRNCDYSIHSKNALAANHKRFLITGVFVGLQAIMTKERSESVQACSPSQGSSPSTHVSQLSLPTTHLTQICLPKNAEPQKFARLSSFSSKITGLTHQESSSAIGNMISEDGLSRVPPLASVIQEQQQPSLLVSVNGDPALSEAPSLPTAKQKQHLQQSVLAESKERLQGAPTGVMPSKAVGSSPSALPSSSVSQEVYLNETRQPLNLGMKSKLHSDAHEINKTDLVTLKGSGCGNVGRSSISEYLTESIPGWRVDELLNLPDFDAMYNYAGTGLSKTDAGTADVEWPAECSASDSDGFGEAVPAEVPRMPSPPTASGVRLTKPWGFGKFLKEPDLDFFLLSDEPLVVPDIGGVTSPTSLSPSSLPQKRRRPYFEF